jgi:biopolymer transport protein ExbD
MNLGGESDGAALGGSKRPPDDEIDITPMIDCVFLLLIFFMVTSTMQQSQERLPAAKHGVGAQSRETMVVTILAPASLTGSPVLQLENGEELSGTGGPTELDETRRGRIVELAGQAQQEGKSRIIVRADRDVPYGFISQVMRAINEAEGMAFSFEVKDASRE